jgi:hypothetical protein
MGKLISMVLMVLGVWVAVEVYTHGVDGAFDGALASRSADRSESSASMASLPKRAGDKVGAAYADADARRKKLLGE